MYSPILKGKRFLVDISSWLYSLSVQRAENSGFFMCIFDCHKRLKERDIHCTYVFDGATPDSKSHTREIRNKTRDDMITKLSDLQCQISMLKKGLDLLDEEQRGLTVNYEMLQEFEEDYTNQCRRSAYLQPEELIVIKDLMHRNNIPYIQADFEADITIADLIRKGKNESECQFDGVFSEDGDYLVHGCDFQVRNTKEFLYDRYEGSQYTTFWIDSKELLNAMGFTRNQMIDFATLLSCDYNQKVLDKVGPVSAYKFIKEHGSLEGFLEWVTNNKKNKHHGKATMEKLQAAQVRKMFGYE